MYAIRSYYVPANMKPIAKKLRLLTINPATFLTGLGNLSRDFLITWAEPNPDVAGT